MDKKIEREIKSIIQCMIAFLIWLDLACMGLYFGYSLDYYGVNFLQGAFLAYFGALMFGAYTLWMLNFFYMEEVKLYGKNKGAR
ncbi:hypothetical protein LCGC14_2549770 [marine sediment metagenome]|uniref:Uncharacterized protein n=1 Tax=marine sediment metagenome TaxID=412755 RepID=A0A0F9BB31_9ZZZZ